MRELKVRREVDRREAARQAGRNYHNPYSLVLHVKLAHYEAEHEALPEDVSAAVVCQDAAGNFPFMVGQSALGDGDPLM